MSCARHRIRDFTLLILCFVLAACSQSDPVEVNFDPDADFSSFGTFAWANGDAGSAVGEYDVPSSTLDEIQTAVTDRLIAKGFELKPDMADADFAVSFVVGAKDIVREQFVTGFIAEKEADWTWGRKYFEGSPVGTQGRRLAYRSVPEGELAIYVFNVEERRPVWRSIGRRDLSRNQLSGAQKDIPADVDRLLEDFPDRIAP